MKKTLFAIACALIFGGPAAAATVTLTFDGDATSTQPIPLATYSQGGFTFALSHTGANSGPALFDTTCTGYSSNCNNDPDMELAVGDQGENGVSGNVLILDANETRPTPNDDANGGTITFTLISGPAFRVLGFSAIDDEEFDLVVGGVVQGAINLSSDNETGISSFISPVTTSFTLVYEGSGGVDSIVLAPVPLPAGVALLLGSLGGFAGLRRLQRRGAA